MPLSADQRAMLQLLLERGQTYADLASLLDVPESEVRKRARTAVAEVAGADPDRNVGLTDWMLGQADPIGRADAVRHLRQDPADHDLAAQTLAKLAIIAPRAELPKLPGEPRGGFLRRSGATAPRSGPQPAAEAATEPARRRLTALEPRQTRLLAGLAISAVILLVAILAIAGAFAGDSEESATTTGASTTSSTTTGTADENFAQVPLKPAEGGDAAGLATVGVAGGGVPFLDLQLRNFEAAPNGETYMVWFSLSPDQGYPLAPLGASAANGSYDHRFTIPTPAIPVISRAREVEVTLIPDSQANAVARSVLQAKQLKDLLIPVRGKAIVRGTVPAPASTGG